MAVIAGGLIVNAFNLQSVLSQGGDATAKITIGSESNPSSRGMHLLVGYVAPLNKYYDEWAGRVHTSLGKALDRWRANVPESQAFRVQRELNNINTDIAPAMRNAISGIDDWNRSVNGQPLDNMHINLALTAALVKVDAAVMATRRGEDLHRITTTDLNAHTDKVLKVFADQGATAARTVGDAVQYAAHVQETRNTMRSYIESDVDFKAKQSIDNAERSSAKTGALGGFIGNVLGALL